MATRDKVVKLGETGLNYAEIGRRVGISRERVRQILNPKHPKPKKPKPEVMLTTRDVCLILRLHPNTVRRWSSQGILKSYRIGPRGYRRFWRGDIDVFLKGAEIFLQKG